MSFAPAELRELVAETAELTGAEVPLSMTADSPVLDLERLQTTSADGWYLVGIIGGKDVGKSALVNALAGAAITESTAWGEGTQQVIAYAHTTRAVAVEELLERQVPRRWRIVTHDIDALANQVLLDLPDIDSHYADHVAVTRHMLRHMLYPVWVQSVEKYADRQIQELLRQVAAGNDPANFVFCLNKVDQVARGPSDDTAVSELREDFARRIANALRLDQPPRVYAVSAIDPGAHDLPDLRSTLSRHKPGEVVDRSIAQAGARQVDTVTRWIEQQQLPDQLDRLRRLYDQAAEAVSARIGTMVEEDLAASTEDDAATRLRIIDDALARRVRAWPLMSILHALLWPILVLIRSNVASSGAAADRASYRQRLADALQATFAQLHQSQPMINRLYAQRKLWDAPAAQREAARLAFAIEQAHRRRTRDLAEQAGRTHAIFAPIRWLLTIGALLWFPFGQPILELLLPTGVWPGLWDLAAMAVRVLSVQILLESAVFILLWYFVLWLVIRWQTQRKVERRLRRGPIASDALQTPHDVTIDWLDDLLQPIRRRIERIELLLERVYRLRPAR